MKRFRKLICLLFRHVPEPVLKTPTTTITQCRRCGRREMYITELFGYHLRRDRNLLAELIQNARNSGYFSAKGEDGKPYLYAASERCNAPRVEVLRRLEGGNDDAEGE